MRRQWILSSSYVNKLWLKTRDAALLVYGQEYQVCRTSIEHTVDLGSTGGISAGETTAGSVVAF